MPSARVQAANPVTWGWSVEPHSLSIFRHWPYRAISRLVQAKNMPVSTLRWMIDRLHKIVVHIPQQAQNLVILRPDIQFPIVVEAVGENIARADEGDKRQRAQVFIGVHDGLGLRLLGGAGQAQGFVHRDRSDAPSARLKSAPGNWREYRNPPPGLPP